MYGAIIGDIVGSRFEFRNLLSKDFAFFAKDCEFTDDTVLTCAVAQALLDCAGDYTSLSEKTVAAMQRIGRRYPYCGYGARFGGWMFSNNPRPYNSCGNGSAMRVSPVGLLADSVDEAKELSAAVTRITHDHPEGMKGAEAVAVAIVMARQGKGKDAIRHYVEEHYYPPIKSAAHYRETWNGHGRETCQISVPQAFACFFEGESFEDVIRTCVSTGGDSDTVAAIAGGMAEAYYGIPDALVAEARTYLDDSLRAICDAFTAKLGENR